MKREMLKIDFIEQVHMALYDVVEEAKPAGAFTFNELDRESVEFRYYLDGLLDASMTPLPINVTSPSSNSA